MAFDSLPDRPLQRTEVDALDDSDSIQGVFPIYGERPEVRDTAYGVVIVANSAAHALVYENKWVTLDRESVESRPEGIAWGDRDTLDELQSLIATRLQQP